MQDQRLAAKVQESVCRIGVSSYQWVREGRRTGRLLESRVGGKQLKIWLGVSEDGLCMFGEIWQDVIGDVIEQVWPLAGEQAAKQAVSARRQAGEPVEPGKHEPSQETAQKQRTAPAQAQHTGSASWSAGQDARYGAFTLVASMLHVS